LNKVTNKKHKDLILFTLIKYLKIWPFFDTRGTGEPLNLFEKLNNIRN